MILYPYNKLSNCAFKREPRTFSHYDTIITDKGVHYRQMNKIQPMSFYDQQRKEEIYDVRKSALYNLSIATSYENSEYEECEDEDYTSTLCDAKENYDDEDNELFLATFGNNSLLSREKDIYHANL